MNKQVLGILETLDLKDQEMVLEAMSILGNPISKKIIQKAASPDSPVGLNEFPEINETTMIRYLRQLHKLGILSPEWIDNQRKFAITETGRLVASIMQS